MAETKQKMKTVEGVSGALVVNNKVLIIRRYKGDTYLAGFYELPGGKMDPGETKEQALVREFAEETGLSVEVGKFYGKHIFYPGPNTKAIDYEYRVYLAPNEDIKNIRLSSEHDHYKLVELSEVDKVEPITPEKVASLKIALGL